MFSMFSRERTHADHLVRLTVVRTDHGWETREEWDHVIVRITRHTDWHRVERSIRLFERDDRALPEAS